MSENIQMRHVYVRVSANAWECGIFDAETDQPLAGVQTLAWSLARDGRSVVTVEFRDLRVVGEQAPTAET